MIEQVLDALGIARVGAPGYEADDVIGTLATRATGPVRIVTGDRDLFQLVNDARQATVVYPLKGVGSAQIIDEAALREKYGVTGAEYADMAALRGDPSDGLPGVKGIGEKTAAQLIREYGDLAGDPRRSRRPPLQAHPRPPQEHPRRRPLPRRRPHRRPRRHRHPPPGVRPHPPPRAAGPDDPGGAGHPLGAGQRAGAGAGGADGLIHSPFTPQLSCVPGSACCQAIRT